MDHFGRIGLLILLAGRLLWADGAISGAGGIGCSGVPVTGTAWTTSTTINTTQILAAAVAAAQVRVTVDQGANITAGALQFQVDPGDGTFVNAASWQVVDPTSATFPTISMPYTMVASTNKQFMILMGGASRLQLTLTTAITTSSGAGTSTPFTTVVCNQLPISVQATASSLSTQANLMIGGTTVDGNSGNKSAQTMRFVLATDQPQLTNKLLVTPDANVKVDVVGNGGASVDSAPQATAPTNVLGMGAAAVNAEQTAATNGQAQRIVTDLVGKLITMPYANPENIVFGSNSATGTGSTSIIAAEGSGVRTYVTDCHVTNTSATNSSVSIEDGSTVLDVLSVPANGGNDALYPTPLRGSANTALNSVAGTAVTTLYVSCHGYKGQ